MVMDREASSWVGQRAHEMIDIIRDEASEMFNNIGREYTRPSVVYKAKLLKTEDGRWSAYYSEQLSIDNGILLNAGRFCVIGSTPDEAMRNFDKLWITKPENKQE